MKTLDQFFPKVKSSIPEGSYILCTVEDTDCTFAKYESGSLRYWNLANGEDDEFYFRDDNPDEEDFQRAIFNAFGIHDLEKCYIATEAEVGNIILAYYGLNVKCSTNNNARKGKVVKKTTKKS